MDYLRLLLSLMTMGDRMHLLTEQDYSMTFNPNKYGNCQFSALAHAFSEYGTCCSPTTLGYEVAKYLRNNPHNAEGLPLDVCLTQHSEDYLQEMSHHGTYRDQITLQAVADMLGVETLVISTPKYEYEYLKDQLSYCVALFLNIFLKKKYVILR